MTPLEIALVLCQVTTLGIDCGLEKRRESAWTPVVAPARLSLAATAFQDWYLRQQEMAAAGAADAQSEAFELVHLHLRGLRDPRASVEETASELAHANSAGLKALFFVLAGGTIPGNGTAPDQTLSGVQHEAILRAFELHETPAVLARFEAWQTEVAGIAVDELGLRRAWIDVIGAVGTFAEFDQLLDRLTAGDWQPDRTERSNLRRALARMLPRLPQPYMQLERVRPKLDAALLRVTVEAAGDCRDTRALDWAGTLLRWHRDLDAIVLPQFAKLTDNLIERPPADLVAALEDRLDPTSPSLCAAACQALGSLEVSSSAEPLVALLSDESQTVRSAAHWSLQRISGLNLPLAASLWRAWMSGEQDWYERQRPIDLAHLKQGSTADRARALESLAVHPLYRHELAPEIARALVDFNGSLGPLACKALVRLDSKLAVPGLVSALFGWEATATAARSALEALLERALPASTEDVVDSLTAAGLLGAAA